MLRLLGVLRPQTQGSDPVGFERVVNEVDTRVAVFKVVHSVATAAVLRSVTVVQGRRRERVVPLSALASPYIGTRTTLVLPQLGL